jgi:hypothetical protein
MRNEAVVSTGRRLSARVAGLRGAVATVTDDCGWSRRNVEFI